MRTKSNLTRWIPRLFSVCYLTLLSISSASAQTLGAGQQAFDIRVVRIFSGQSTTYVTFTSLPGCNGNGGYLTVSWPAVNGGVFDQHRTSQIVATLLFAKATETSMEVRYRHNPANAGWDSCAIDAVFLN